MLYTVTSRITFKRHHKNNMGFSLSGRNTQAGLPVSQTLTYLYSSHPKHPYVEVYLFGYWQHHTCKTLLNFFKYMVLYDGYCRDLVLESNIWLGSGLKLMELSVGLFNPKYASLGWLSGGHIYLMGLLAFKPYFLFLQ